MKIRIITYLSVLGILLILLSQVYIVYENYRQARDYLTRESTAIIETAFCKDLNNRYRCYKQIIGEDTITTPPSPTKKNTSNYNLKKTDDYSGNVLGLLDLAINTHISKLVPMDMHKLDSVTGTILRARHIHSSYFINLADPRTGQVTEPSNKEFKHSLFLIPSNYLTIDLAQQKAIQLVLVNPFASIFIRTGTLLVGSLFLSLFCFYGFWFLFHTLARQKKLMAVKNDFFGNTAHELKRPVTQLHLALEALSKPAVAENTVKRERYLAISKEATRDMSEKINMIMTLSMAEEGVFRLNYSEFDLTGMLAGLKEKFISIVEKKVTIQIENPDEEVIVKADRDHLSQCIANLLDNAIRYSGESVEILISIQKNGNELILCVKDNGVGIRPEKINRVFEKYTRLNTAPGSPSGFGIGLSYVKTVIEKHAGRIELKSEETKGSEFILHLPV